MFYKSNVLTVLKRIEENIMKIYLEEKIGNPALFTGRKRELDSLLEWTKKIKLKISKSKAIISRRKTGKSALMERLFKNTIKFFNDNGIAWSDDKRLLDN